MSKNRKYKMLTVLLCTMWSANIFASETLLDLAKSVSDGSAESGVFAATANAEVLRLLQQEPTEDDRRAIPSLAAAYSLAPPDIQADLLKLLEHLLAGSGEYRPTILDTARDALASPTAEVRVAALAVLGKSDDPAFIPSILPSMQDADWNVRYQALYSISIFAETGAYPEIYTAIEPLVDDVNERVRVAARSLMKYALVQ